MAGRLPGAPNDFVRAVSPTVVGDDAEISHWTTAAAPPPRSEDDGVAARRAPRLNDSSGRSAPNSPARPSTMPSGPRRSPDCGARVVSDVPRPGWSGHGPAGGGRPTPLRGDGGDGVGRRRCSASAPDALPGADSIAPAVVWFGYVDLLGGLLSRPARRLPTWTAPVSAMLRRCRGDGGARGCSGRRPEPDRMVDQ